MLGRYDTPRPLSQAISDWAICTPCDEALEPSSGSGVFVLSLVHRLRQLGQKNPQKQIWACDIDPDACAQTKRATRLADSHVWTDDFLSLVSPNGVKGRKFDCIVGNPPYISLHRMPLDQRQRAVQTTKRLMLNLGGRASLWAYFLSASVHALRLGGRIAFILPESTLHAEYALSVVRVLARSFQRCTLVSLRERCFASDGAAERVVLLLADGFCSTARATDVSLHECISADDAIRTLATMRSTPITGLPRLNGHAVPHLLRSNVEPMIEIDTAPHSRSLGDLADVRIGVVTGADHFFLLTENQRKEIRLRRAWLTPSLPRFQQCRALSFTRTDWRQLCDRGEKCWLLSPKDEVVSAALCSYLDQFPVTERERNSTFRKRSLWYSPVMGQKPHAFLRYMGVAGPRIAFARFHVTCPNTIHRVYFNQGVLALERKAIVDFRYTPPTVNCQPNLKDGPTDLEY